MRFCVDETHNVIYALALDEEKVDYVCTYENEHFGDFSEWRSVYNLKNVRKGSSYYAFVNESYITPEKKNTNYRTDDIIYKYDPTLGVRGIQAILPEILKGQIDAVFEDFTIDAVKTGMLHNTDAIKVTSEAIDKYQPKWDSMLLARPTATWNVL